MSNFGKMRFGDHSCDILNLDQWFRRCLKKRFGDNTDCLMVHTGPQHRPDVICGTKAYHKSSPLSNSCSDEHGFFER